MHFSANSRWAYAVGLGVAFGMFFQFVFTRIGSAWGGTMMLGFLVGVPIGLGAVSAHFTPPELGKWRRYVERPWLLNLAFILTALVFKVEGTICLLIILPLFLLLGIVGVGLYDLVTRRARRHGPYALTILVLLPVYLGCCETYFRSPDSRQRVENRITIAAPAAAVWQQIIRVPAIQPAELGRSPIDWLGFPRPVEATLSHEGVGGVRHATFEGGVLFVETVDRWEPLRCLSFGIRARTETIPPTTFDEHVVVGGRYFDVLRGTYEMRDVGSGHTELILWSDHRINTRLNPYAGLWTRYVMSEIQRRILTVVKNRAEAG